MSGLGKHATDGAFVRRQHRKCVGHKAVSQNHDISMDCGSQNSKILLASHVRPQCMARATQSARMNVSLPNEEAGIQNIPTDLTCSLHRSLDA